MASPCKRQFTDCLKAQFHLKGGKKIVFPKPPKAYDGLLEVCNFFRIHISHSVHLNYIEKQVKGKVGYVIMDDGSLMDVSVRRKEVLLRGVMQVE